MLFLIAKIFFWTIGILFFLGFAGSALVVILTSIEDAKELREKKEDESSPGIENSHFGDSFPVGAAPGR